MASIRPADLPAAGSVSNDDITIVDTGAGVFKATPSQIVDAATPLASQVEAEAGTNNAKRMTPLRVKQAISAQAVARTSPQFDGSPKYVLDGGRIGITSRNTILSPVDGVQHILNDDSAGIGLHVDSRWTGTTADPYTNNDCVLFDVYNNVLSNSANRSWAASCGNPYHNVPVGVTDSGTRVGVIGWATSVAGKPGYEHRGTIAEMTGVMGTSGFQSPGTPSTAVIQEACGGRFLIYSDSAGATINFARAVLAVSDAVASTIQENCAVYARATGGTVNNFSFYGQGGVLLNEGAIYSPARVQGKSQTYQTTAGVTARGANNGIEFGNDDPGGYASTIGSTHAGGFPFIAFNAEADSSGDTFRTRGFKGTAIYSPLNGSMRFGRLPTASAAGQALDLMAQFSPAGNFQTFYNPIFSSAPPASTAAAGTAGEIAWDSGYIYVCVADNSWKRAALSTW